MKNTSQIGSITIEMESSAKSRALKAEALLTYKMALVRPITWNLRRCHLLYYTRTAYVAPRPYKVSAVHTFMSTRSAVYSRVRGLHRPIAP